MCNRNYCEQLIFCVLCSMYTVLCISYIINCSTPLNYINIFYLKIQVNLDDEEIKDPDKEDKKGKKSSKA